MPDLKPSTVINPRDPALNYVIARGIRSPGRAQLSEVGAEFNWKVHEGYALSGGSTQFLGRKVSKFSLTISMWLPEHFAQWALFKDAIKPPTPTAPFYFDMAHPLLSSADIKAVGVESLNEPVRASSGGLWTAVIKLLEYRPWKDALVKPDKSIPAPDKGATIAPKTEAQREVEKAKLELRAAATARPKR